MSLSKEGRGWSTAAKLDIWPSIDDAVTDLCDPLDGPLLEQLAAIEDGLAAMPLNRRTRRRNDEPYPRPSDWKASSTRHAALARGNGPAKRYAPSIHPFASSRDESPESLPALADIAAPGETSIILQANEIMPPPGLTAT